MQCQVFYGVEPAAANQEAGVIPGSAFRSEAISLTAAACRASLVRAWDCPQTSKVSTLLSCPTTLQGRREQLTCLR